MTGLFKAELFAKIKQKQKQPKPKQQQKQYKTNKKGKLPHCTSKVNNQSALECYRIKSKEQFIHCSQLTQTKSIA